VCVCVCVCVHAVGQWASRAAQSARNAFLLQIIFIFTTGIAHTPCQQVYQHLLTAVSIKFQASHTCKCGSIGNIQPRAYSDHRTSNTTMKRQGVYLCAVNWQCCLACCRAEAATSEHPLFGWCICCWLCTSMIHTWTHSRSCRTCQPTCLCRSTTLAGRFV